MDAWKFDYRLYYDVFVKNTMKDTIFACLAPAITDAVASKSGDVLSVTASAEGADLEYQWYIADEKYDNIKAIAGAKAASYTLKGDEKNATHYFVRIKANGTTITDAKI